MCLFLRICILYIYIYLYTSQSCSGSSDFLSWNFQLTYPLVCNFFMGDGKSGFYINVRSKTIITINQFHTCNVSVYNNVVILYYDQA
jgi:hypothetical protein